jgi:oligopeptide/dipeptide ABC transporter ATP-binding protein
MSAVEPLLEVEGLKVQFATEDGIVKAVDGVSFSLEKGKVLGIVGESGSGKSVTSMTLLGLTRGPNARFEGSVRYHGMDLVKASESQLQKVRGAGIAMIFQDPMTSLNPVQKIGDQIVEMIRAHEPLDKKAARQRTIDLLGEVGIANPAGRIDSYPHEFSGGMRQRVMIAMALACSPDVLIADEPTTALDVTIQAQILELIAKLKDEFGTAVILITHDLGVVARLSDDIAVMYAGRIVEQGPKGSIFYDPQHPYTWGLLGSIPRIDQPKPPHLHAIPGLPPSLIRPPEGCKFRPRCPHAFDKCMQEPDLVARVEQADHLDRCWLDPEDKRNRRTATIRPNESEEAA